MSYKAEDVSRLVKVYRSLAKYPSLTGGRILKKTEDNDIRVSAVWTQKNLEKGKNVKFIQHIFVKPPKYFDLPSDVSTESFCSFSNSENYRAAVTDDTSSTPKKQYLEIWGKNGLLKNFDVAAFDVHGDIYADGEFGSLEFSPDEKKIAYVAEKKLVKSEPYYKQKSLEAKNKIDPTVEYNEFLYKQDWGEQLVDKHQSVIGICDLDSEILSVLQGVPDNYCPGQIIWSKDGSSIFGIALEKEPRRLGLIYCTNRKGLVFQLSLKNEFKILSEENKSVRSPRLSTDGNIIYWLQRAVGGPHDGTQEIISYDLRTNERKTIVSIEESEAEFPGIYTHNFPRRCFSNDGKFLYFNSFAKNKNKVYYVDLDKTAIHEVPDNEEGSFSVFDVSNDVILCCSTSFQRPHKLKIAPDAKNPNWISISPENVIQDNFVFNYLDFDSAIHAEEIPNFNGLFYGPPQPSDGQKIPLVVLPHGGPHSGIPNSFSFDVAFFTSLGFAVLMVNYRGSTGCGEKFVKFLTGKIGESDVNDMHTATLSTLKLYPYLDENKVVVYGGSHGGFLSVHLIAQYPDFYKAAVVRNPVVDVSVMFGISDIPDWCTVESGFDYRLDTPLKTEEVAALATKSPIYIADKIKAPTLWLLGKKDLRVPCSQGLQCHYLLKARNVTSRVHMYDDNHPLAQTPVHLDSLISSGLWFSEHLGLL